MARDYLIHSVKKALQILRLFTPDRPEWGITEVSSSLGLSKSTTHRLMATLTNRGYLEKNLENDRYQLGLALLTLSGVLMTHHDIYRESIPLLNRLVEQLGEAAHIGILEDRDIVYLHKVESRHPVRLLSHIGKKNPAHCSSAGKAILAYQTEENILEFLQGNPLAPYGPNTITDADAFLKDLQLVCQNGYSLAVEELHAGVASLAVPVRDYTGEVTAALNIVGPTERMTNDVIPMCIDKLKQAAAELSKKLGY